MKLRSSPIRGLFVSGLQMSRTAGMFIQASLSRKEFVVANAEGWILGLHPALAGKSAPLRAENSSPDRSRIQSNGVGEHAWPT